MKNPNSIISVLFGLVVVFLLTCGLEPLDLTTKTGVPHAFISDSDLQVSPSVLDTSLFTICDTIHVGDTIRLMGAIIPPDSRIKNCRWNFGDNTQDTNAQITHVYNNSGIFQATFTVFDGVGNSLTDSVSVCVNTPPDSIQILSPANGSIVQSITPIVLSWKGYDRDLFDSLLTYTVLYEKANLTFDTIVNGINTTSTILKGNLLQEKQLSWVVVARDRFGDVKSSAKSTFSIKSGDDALLSVLNVSVGTLNPVFSDSILSYVDSVPSSTPSINITAIPRDISAKVSIKDSALSFGDSTLLIAIVPDMPNEIPVKVTSQNSTEIKTYMITVIPAQPPVIVVPDDTIFLSSIVVSEGNLFPAIMPPADSLRDTVLYSTTSITINAAANDSLATIVVGSSDTIKSGESSPPLTLNYGTTVIPIRVTHHKGKPDITYTVSVFRPAIPDTLLSSLEISAGTLRTVNAPVPDTLQDTVSFLDSVITITPSALDSQSSITVDSVAVKSSSRSQLINLPVGTTVVKIMVASLSGTKSKEYILCIVRKDDSTTPLTTPPSGVAANGISVSSIRVTWDDNLNATFYTIQRSTLADSGFADAGNSTSNSYNDTALDSGTTFYYRVSAANSRGATAYSTIVSATSFQKPFFTEQPQNLTAIERTQAIFSASAQGIPAPTYSWQKNGIDINVTSSACTTNVLSLSDNNTIFRCIASNEAGNVISNEAVLTVDSMFTKPAIIRQPGDTEVFFGDTAILTIADTGSYLKRQWRKDGTNLPEAVSCTLSINGAKPTDAGIYTVKVWNRSDSAVTTSFRLRVLPKGEAALTAQARSASSIGVSWNSIDGAQWYRVLRASGSNSFASICSTSQTSIIDTLLTEGTSYSYKLIAGNNNSGDNPTKDSVVTTTWYGPRITTQPQPISITAGQTISLSVVAAGLPACSYQWKKDGDIIPGATLPGFTLTNAAPDDSGDYSVQLTNAVRVVNSSSAHVSVIPVYSLSTPSEPAIGGTVVRSKIADLYERGDTVRLIARAASGYRFTGWSGDTAASDSSIRVSMNKNKLISANFIKQFKLTLSGMTHGEVNPSGTSIVDSGASTTITATADAKYKFVVWRIISGNATIDDTNNASTSIKLVHGDASVEGRFVTTDTGRSAGCGKTFSTLTSGTYTITSSGMNRSYIVDIPEDYDNNKPYRLIFGMHFMGGSAEKVAGTGTDQTANFYHLKPYATSNNIPCIFVAPQGNIDGTWDSSKDPVFFSDLLKLIKDTLCIDTTRVFCSGFSFGAMFTYALSLAYPTQLRAVACYAPVNYNFTQPTDNHVPIAYYQTTGTSDGTCPWINSDLNKTGGKYCLLTHIQNNGCTEPSTIPLATSSYHVSTEFTGGIEGYPVKFSSFVGPHTCTASDPGSDVNWIAEETWEFFMRF